MMEKASAAPTRSIRLSIRRSIAAVAAVPCGGPVWHHGRHRQQSINVARLGPAGPGRGGEGGRLGDPVRTTCPSLSPTAGVRGYSSTARIVTVLFSRLGAQSAVGVVPGAAIARRRGDPRASARRWPRPASRRSCRHGCAGLRRVHVSAAGGAGRGSRCCNPSQSISINVSSRRAAPNHICLPPCHRPSLPPLLPLDPPLRSPPPPPGVVRRCCVPLAGLVSLCPPRRRRWAGPPRKGRGRLAPAQALLSGGPLPCQAHSQTISPPIDSNDGTSGPPLWRGGSLNLSIGLKGD